MIMIMMYKKLFPAFLMSCFLTFTACSDDDDFDSVANEAVEQAFNQKYPGVRADWDMEQGYYKAEFHENSNEKEAWFNAAGEWMLTETDLTYQQLPAAVKTGFETSSYAQWKVEDVDMLERHAMEPVYVIEVEQGNKEFDLVFAEDGMLIKEIPDNDNEGNHTPFVPSESIVNTIQKLYPTAQILEVEKEAEGIEVDILDKGIHKEVLLNGKNEWMYTQWDILASSLPVAVREAIANMGYTMNEVDDAEIIEHNNGTSYYKVELEKGEVEKEVYFTQDGQEVKNPLI